MHEQAGCILVRSTPSLPLLSLLLLLCLTCVLLLSPCNAHSCKGGHGRTPYVPLCEAQAGSAVPAVAVAAGEPNTGESSWSCVSRRQPASINSRRSTNSFHNWLTSNAPAWPASYGKQQCVHSCVVFVVIPSLLLQVSNLVEDAQAGKALKAPTSSSTTTPLSPTTAHAIFAATVRCASSSWQLRRVGCCLCDCSCATACQQAHSLA